MDKGSRTCAEASRSHQKAGTICVSFWFEYSCRKIWKEWKEKEINSFPQLADLLLPVSTLLCSALLQAENSGTTGAATHTQEGFFFQRENLAFPGH